MLLLGLALGLAVGLFACLVPGLHAALALTVLVGLGLSHVLGPLPAAAFVATAGGASLYMKRLGTVYHPTSGAADALSLDPALRLAKDGRALDALALMVLGTDLAWGVVVLAGIACAVGALLGQNLAQLANEAFNLVGSAVIVFWVARTVWNAGHQVKTLVGFSLTGLFGYACLHHPALAGGDQAIAPLLAGLFGLPLMWQVLAEARAERRRTGQPLSLPTQGPRTPDLQVTLSLGFVGALLGALTGFLSGLGTSSLVSLADASTDGDEDYLLLASAGEAANDLMAVFLAIAAGSTHSGESVLLQRLVPAPDLATGACLLAATAFGAWAGRRALAHLTSPYQALVKRLPVTLSAVAVILFSLGPVAMAGAPVAAFGLTAVGTALGLWCRSQHLPAQVAFGSLAIPLVLSRWGCVPTLNLWLFS